MRPRRSRQSSSGIRVYLPFIPQPCSIVTHGAVDPGFPLFVTFQAPAHVERALLPHYLHRLDRAMTLLALEAGLDVTHVREVYVVRQIVNAHPRNRTLFLPVGSELLHTGSVRPDHRYATGQMTTGAYLDGRNPGVDRTIGRGVAIHAGDLIGTGVKLVGESDGLFRPATALTERSAHHREHRGCSDGTRGRDPEHHPLRSTHHAPSW